MKEKKLLVLVGPPGSGKSTFANELFEKGWTRINQDEQGKEGHKDLFLKALYLDRNIVIDRMNFNKEQRARYIDKAKEKGYSIEIRTFFVPYDFCLKRCLIRADHPTIKDDQTAISALNTFFSKFERPTEDEGVLTFDYGKVDKLQKPIIIVDLDGTLCNIDHRLHYVRNPDKKDWSSFFTELKNDSVNEWCKTLIKQLEQNNQIIYCSGRPDTYFSETSQWLYDNNCTSEYLFMRKKGDYRDDSIIKEIILDFEILTRGNVLLSIDDRKRVCDMWRSRGIICLQCDEGNF